MPEKQQGGCLCGKIRFEVTADQDRNAYRCSCDFCRHTTGGDYLTEICFLKEEFKLLSGQPSVYTHISGGSGKEVYLHFCPDCGSALYLTLERWTETLNVLLGAFDDPNWFDFTPESTRYLFMKTAPRGMIIPAGYRYFDAHCVDLEGNDIAPKISDRPTVLG